MASSVAKQLLLSNEIDVVFCFSPSVNVATSFKATLETVLKCRLDGLLGAYGQVLTYQSMLNLGESFWSLLASHRSLIIFDEIHHCAGDHLGNANAWGQKIIQHIQGKATYTMALTGTPWRSDRIPIALSSYCQQGTVHCDYRYGLDQAIKDRVCRIPKITAIDNENISVKTGDKVEKYKSFGGLLKHSKCSYQQLLDNTTLINYLVKSSVEKLNSIRKTNKNAAGLIVAASVEHALKTADLLHKISGEKPLIATYIHDDSQEIIQQFRDSNAKWIISVGMISEGTDIPRLRVCCHLTRVKTELYFRQVLGRILRAQKSAIEKAYLFMPAEPSLIEYAERVAEDVPESNTISLNLMNDTPTLEPIASPLDESISDSNESFELSISNGMDSVTSSITSTSNTEETSEAFTFSTLSEAYEATVDLFGRFKKRMIRVSLLNV